jgi:hypothetical protein
LEADGAHDSFKDCDREVEEAHGGSGKSRGHKNVVREVEEAQRGSGRLALQDEGRKKRAEFRATATLFI